MQHTEEREAQHWETDLLLRLQTLFPLEQTREYLALCA